MNQIAVGKIAGVHGLKGHLVVRHSLGQRTDFKDVAAIFVGGHSSQMLPYFITEAIGRNQTDTVVLLEDITTREKALELINKPVALKMQDFNRLVSRQSPLGLVGFSVIEQEKVLGTISNVSEQTMQAIATVIVGEKEALIPLHKETIVSIDRVKKQVHVTLPDGLLAIYL